MVKDNGDGTKTVKYTPEDCGPYEISVTYGGEPVPGAPFKTTAIPTGDASKCKLTGKGCVYICVVVGLWNLINKIQLLIKKKEKKYREDAGKRRKLELKGDKYIFQYQDWVALSQDSGMLRSKIKWLSHLV